MPKKKQTPFKVDSYQRGLGAALTNPTELARKRGNIAKAYPITFAGRRWPDLEAAYKAHKVDEYTNTPPREQSHNYALMVQLMRIKLRTYPDLVEAITARGGTAFLHTIKHQPTKKGSVWETSGQDWFKLALIEAYRSADMCGDRWLETGSPWPPANDNPDLEAKPAPKKAGKPKTPKSRPAPNPRPSKGRPWVQLPLPLRRNGKALPQPQPKTAKEA